MVKWKTAKIPLIPYKPSSPESAPQSGPTSKSHRLLLLLSWCNHLAANPLNNFHLPTRSPVLYTYMHTVIKANCAEDSWYLNFHPCQPPRGHFVRTYLLYDVCTFRESLAGWSLVRSTNPENCSLPPLKVPSCGQTPMEWKINRVCGCVYCRPLYPLSRPILCATSGCCCCCCPFGPLGTRIITNDFFRSALDKWDPK